MDPVVKEFQVYVNTQLTPHLHLIQTPVVTPPCSAMEGGRYKRNAKRLEWTWSLDPHSPHFQSQERRDSNTENKMVLSGGPVPLGQARYFVACLKDENEIHLTPIPHAIQLRPSFEHLEQARQLQQKKSDEAPASRGGKSTPTSAATTAVFRRRETEEQMQARLNSYAHLQKQVDDEPWIPLRYSSLDTEDARAVANRLFTPHTEPLGHVDTPDYTQQLLK